MKKHEFLRLKSAVFVVSPSFSGGNRVTVPFFGGQGCFFGVLFVLLRWEARKNCSKGVSVLCF